VSVPARRVVTGVLVAALALLPLVGLVWLATAAASRAEAGEPAPAAAEPSPGPQVATPLLSARRVPGVVTGQLVTAPMVDALGAVAAGMGDQSCLAVAIDGQVVFEAGDGRQVMPASNLKLLTGAVAIDVLGADTTFETRVVADAVADGKVGTLYLVGGGDPLLATQPYLTAVAAQGHEVPEPHTSLEALADQVVAAGVREVAGGVVGDDSRYDAERYVPSWPASYRTAGEAGPLGALLVNDGLRSFSPPRETTDPAAHAASVFAALLRDRGVSVATTGRAGTAPASGTTVASAHSVPMRDVVGEMLLTSDDNTAELLLKEIGRDGQGVGSREAGLQVERDTLASWGVPLDGTSLVDGSGLDRGNRVSCDTLVGVLAHSPPGTPVADGLPLAGSSGTLAGLFRGNPMEGRLRAKTGTLTGARALSGWVAADDGKVVDVAFVVNGSNASQRALPLWDRLGRALALYPARPDLTPFAPLPARNA
jgi:serine-type D-Ala-D-Ala carboxypeptidase/endopeptidase (penicillin-binding protein 4)